VPYPSLYRAKAVSIRSGAVDAFVPQVFGEATVTITESLGSLPTAPGMGWVFFQAGNPEFPVWSSGLGTGSAGNGNGPPVEPVVVPDEVWVGVTEPTDPDIELWFDPDEVIPVQRQVVEAKGLVTSYTLLLTDENKVLWFSASTAIALTIPLYANVSFPDGARIDILQTGAGRITVGGAGVSIIATPTAVLRGQGSAASLLKLSTNTWLVTGDTG